MRREGVGREGGRGAVHRTSYLHSPGKLQPAFISHKGGIFHLMQFAIVVRASSEKCVCVCVCVTLQK